MQSFIESSSRPKPDPIRGGRRPIVADELRDRLKRDGLLLTWFCLGSVPVIELAAKAGSAAAVLDLQHGLWDRLSAHLAVGALGNVPVIARVAANTPAAIGEALDSGAVGILVPLVETEEEATAAVSAASFPPRGVRSGGGVRPLSQGFQTYLQDYGRPLIGLMIETSRGICNAASIAGTPGVDFVFIGTADLALSIGARGPDDERHEAACQMVRTTCQEAKVPCGIFTSTAEAARQRLAQGFAVAVLATDIAVVAQGFKAAMDETVDTRRGRRVDT